MFNVCFKENLDKWRCPGCQTIHEQMPLKYTCFCGKKTNPTSSREDENKPFHLRQLPHSCGDLCGKQIILSTTFWQQQQDQEGVQLDAALECKHKCLQSCHPGPCQPCDALVTRKCNCTKNSFQVKCSSSKVPICDKKCVEKLNCKLHECDRVCHAGKCPPCDRDIEQSCYSHGDKRVVKCGSDQLAFKHQETEENFFYKCDLKCDKLLQCGNHRCKERCHQGECGVCPLMPSKLVYCPCGKTQMKELLIKNKAIRTSCLDPVLVCDKKCEKPSCDGG